MVGYRLAQYGQDLLLDYQELVRVRKGIRGKGIKGAVGTSASYTELLAGTGMTAVELEKRGGDATDVRSAAEAMDHSSNLFRRLRYEDDLSIAVDILQSIAETELEALAAMEIAWPVIKDV